MKPRIRVTNIDGDWFVVNKAPNGFIVYETLSSWLLWLTLMRVNPVIIN